MRLLLAVVAVFILGGTAQAQARPVSPFASRSETAAPYTIELRAAPSTARWSLIGAAVGGGLMAFYAARTCTRNSCNLSPVPYVAAGAVVGGLVGYTYADGLRRYPRRRDEG